jgi:hypothetical protein
LDFPVCFIRPTPDFVYGRIARNPEEPGKELRLGRIIRMGLVPDLYKTLLKYILGDFLILHHLVGYPVERIPIVFIKERNGFVIALVQKFHNMFFQQRTHGQVDAEKKEASGIQIYFTGRI